MSWRRTVTRGKAVFDEVCAAPDKVIDAFEVPGEKGVVYETEDISVIGFQSLEKPLGLEEGTSDLDSNYEYSDLMAWVNCPNFEDEEQIEKLYPKTYAQYLEKLW